VSVDSDDVAISHGIEREEMDEWALRSHQNYGAAFDAGKFKEEIFPIEVKISRQDPFVLEKDEQYRENMSMEMLGRLKPIYGSKGITAGNAPGLNDGATAILFMTRKKADELGLEPLASIVSMTSIATKPNNLPEGPAFAMQKALELAGLGIDDIDVMEVNEAFAAVTLVSTYLLGDKDKAKVEAIRKKTNINGSAIAIGHPNTSSGARVIMNLMYELRRRGGGYAMGSICGGLAQADATIIKVE
jgi:acetyl-CoA C-acetyltransferase